MDVVDVFGVFVFIVKFIFCGFFVCEGIIDLVGSVILWSRVDVFVNVVMLFKFE